jgi:hypothetical protein
MAKPTKKRKKSLSSKKSQKPNLKKAQQKQPAVPAKGNIAKVRKKNRKVNFMPTASMWINTLLAHFRSDMGTIPPDIGDEIFIGDNVYVTKDYISSVILIEEFSLDTVLGVCSELLHHIKTIQPSVIVDVTMKASKYELDFGDLALKNRMQALKDSLDSDKIADHVKERNAWMVFSYETMKSGKTTYIARVFVTIRAKQNSILQKALKAAMGYLGEYNIEAKIIKSNLTHYFDFMSPIINRANSASKDIPYVVGTGNSIAELLPTTQGLNDEIGLLLGIDRMSENPYLIDLKGTARAKNFYVLGPSGEGKTFLVLTWLLDAFTQDYRISITDVKGNEFTSFTESCNGSVISMKPGATFYINTFKLDKNAINGKPVMEYYNENMRITKTVLMLICNPTEHNRVKVASLMEEFLQTLYLQVGVVAENPNTWERSSQLTPFKVFEYFMTFVSPSIRNIYSDVIEDVILNFKTYMSPTGTGSDLFRREFDISSVLNSRVVTFDFGMLSDTRVADEVTTSLKYFFSKLVTDAYVANNKKQGLHTIYVMEESQLANAVLREMYAEAMSLRRAQNQINIMLGNSISGLKGDKSAEIILENINIWVLGRLTKANKDYLVNEYSMEEFEPIMDDINVNSDYDRTFLVVNRLNRNTTSAAIKAFVPKDVVNSSVFRVVDATKSEGV